MRLLGLRELQNFWILAGWRGWDRLEREEWMRVGAEKGAQVPG